MNTVTRVQILDETDCISHNTNTLGKGMNPIILPPAMSRLGFSALVRQLVYEKENSEFKPDKLRLKIDLGSYPARTEGLVNMVNQLKLVSPSCLLLTHFNNFRNEELTLLFFNLSRLVSSSWSLKLQRFGGKLKKQKKTKLKGFSNIRLFLLVITAKKKQKL